MNVSEEQERKKQGFESWTASKKSRRKPASTKRVLSQEYGNENKSPSADMPGPTHRLSGKNVNIVQALQKEKSRRQSGSGSARRTEVEGTVVITEKEYRRLLSLKQKSRAMEREISDDDMNGASKKKDAFAQSNECRADVGDMGERLNKCLPSSSKVLKENEFDIDNLIGEKGKQKVLVESETAKEVASGEEAWPTTSDGDTSDSDFQSMPKRRRAAGHIFGGSLQRSLQNASSKPMQKSGASSASLQDRRLVQGRRNGGHEQSQHLTHKEPPSKQSPGHGPLLNRRSAEDISSGRKKHLSNAEVVFPFEKVLEEDDLDPPGVGASTQHVSCSDGDHDFDDETPNDRGKGDIVMKPILKESNARANRKRKKVYQDLAMRKREAGGQKPFYIMVNAIGSPYGDGLSAWRAKVNKLSQALDPSIRDIRQQPHQKIEILKKRLTDKFDYSGVISDKFLLPLLGQKVSARRNELMNANRGGRGRPSGVDKGAWCRLESICRSPNFERKSAAMRYANACRLNVDRTGPGGEIGVNDSLKQSLRRSPDLEEVQAEMTQDKGYGGKKKKTKAVVGSERVEGEKRQFNGEGVVNNSEIRQYLLERNSTDTADQDERSCLQEGMKETSSNQAELIRKMLNDIKVLKKKVEGNISEATCIEKEMAAHSVTITGPASPCPRVTEQAEPNS